MHKGQDQVNFVEELKNYEAIHKRLLDFHLIFYVINVKIGLSHGIHEI